MRIRSLGIVIGAWVALVTPAVQAEELPVLPSAEEISKLSAPAYFKDSNRQQLTKPVGTAAQGKSTGDSVPVAVEAPIDVISIDLTKLRAPAAIASQGKTLIVGERGPAAGPMTLQLAGETFELAWIAETTEPSSTVRHESMQIRNVPGGYARFTVNGDNVVGTIVTPQTIYRITPYGAGRQAVFRTSDGAAAKYQRKLRDDSSAAHLERRHVQIERIAQIQPHYIDLNDAGRFLRVRGGQLGRLKDKIDEAAVLAYLQSLDALVNLPDNAQIRLEEVKTFKGRKLIVFHQMISGVPLRAGSELETDGQGTVTGITTDFTDPQSVTAVTISQAEAQQLAVKAIENKLRIALREVELIRPTELYYDVVAAAQKTMPIYFFYMESKQANGSWLVFVNATTGKAWLAENPQMLGETAH